MAKKATVKKIAPKKAAAKKPARRAPSKSTGAFIKPGEYCIVRARDAGVHAGEYVSHSGREVSLTNSRRLWYWKANDSVSLSGVAESGVSSQSKIAPAVARIVIGDACEIIPCTKTARDSIVSAPIARAS